LPATTAPARPSSKPRPAPVAEGVPSSIDPRAPRLVGLASVRGFVNHPGALWGGGVRVGQEPLDRLSWAVDTLYETGHIGLSDGRLKTDTWTIGGQLFYTVGTDRLQGRAGAGVRAGMVATRPSGAESSGRAAAPWGWPFGALSTTLRADPIVLDLSVEGGYVVLPVDQGASGFSVKGVWLSAQLGLGVVL
jgi:hypothetical protein